MMTQIYFCIYIIYINYIFNYSKNFTTQTSQKRYVFLRFLKNRDYKKSILFYIIFIIFFIIYQLSIQDNYFEYPQGYVSILPKLSGDCICLLS